MAKNEAICVLEEYQGDKTSPSGEWVEIRRSPNCDSIKEQAEARARLRAKRFGASAFARVRVRRIYD